MGGQSDSGGAMKDILSGTVAGFAQVAAGHPLDTVKVRLQTQSSINPEFKGVMDCVRKTIAKEGALGLYSGAASPLLGAMAHNAGVFYSYGAGKRIVGNGRKDLTALQCFKAGSLAAIPISAVEAPVDLFKIKLQKQVGKGEYDGVVHCAKKVVGQYGIRGAYQGFGAVLLRNIPCFGAYFCAFEATSKALSKPGKQASLFATFIAGGSAGFSFWGLLYPLETIKTRMQGDATNPILRLYSSIPDCFRKTYAENGLKTFYKGYAPSLLRAVPVNAAIFAGFTAAKRALAEMSPQPLTKNYAA